MKENRWTSYESASELPDGQVHLMTDVLGYKEYVALGGDKGCGVTCYLVSQYPNEVKADILQARNLLEAFFA